MRESLGLSQADIAQRSGLTRPYLSAIERGKQNITLEAGLRIAGALEVGMTDLLEEEWS
ncbi:MAG: helix-turn-helix transcriptional regulator [Thermoanaerobaculia bacterium]|nr:helix-turn-helix transcriptional regulator [Thermoanaerobaculia bacterium]